MKIGNINIDGKFILAPMAGYTNYPFRNICGKCGAALTYSEMISDKGLLFDNARTLRMASGDNDLFPLSIQIFGGDIEEMVLAAKIIDKDVKCDIIDINMGCPVRKVIKAKSGSFLLTDIEYAKSMLDAIIKNVSKPVTVKIRTGFDHDHINCVEFAKMCESVGVSAIAIHGRCKSDMYAGHVDLDLIKAVKDAVNIPVIGNGDVKTFEDAKRMLEYTKVDAVMIGRASLGNPWIFSEFNAKLEGKEFAYPSKLERIETLKSHIDELIKMKGENIAILEMRQIAMFYTKGFKEQKEFKDKVVKVRTRKELFACIDELSNKQMN